MFNTLNINDIDLIEKLYIKIIKELKEQEFVQPQNAFYILFCMLISYYCVNNTQSHELNDFVKKMSKGVKVLYYMQEPNKNEQNKNSWGIF